MFLKIKSLTSSVTQGKIKTERKATNPKKTPIKTVSLFQSGWFPENEGQRNSNSEIFAQHSLSPNWANEIRFKTNNRHKIRPRKSNQEKTGGHRKWARTNRCEEKGSDDEERHIDVERHVARPTIGLRPPKYRARQQTERESTHRKADA